MSVCVCVCVIVKGFPLLLHPHQESSSLSVTMDLCLEALEPVVGADPLAGMLIWAGPLAGVLAWDLSDQDVC